MKDLNTLLQAIPGRKIAAYLKANNWKELDSVFNGRVLQFLSPDSEISILLPIDSDFSDYTEGMYNAIRIIAQKEKMSFAGFVAKLANPASDILKWRVANDLTAKGSIPFSAMEETIGSIKNILSTACLDVISPAKYHAKLFTKDVKEQLSKYEFGQTEIGSYILNVICPLGQYQYNLFNAEEEDIPLSRKINIKVIDSISRLQHYVADGGQELDEKVDEGKISINFLSALSDIYEEFRDSELTISAKWNSYVPILNNNVPDNVQLIPIYNEKIISVIEKYTPKQDTETERHFFGKIINIGAEAEVDNRSSVDIKIATIGENGKAITIYTTLGYSEYFSIVDRAFTDGLNVKISGFAETSMKKIKLINAKIEIVD